LKANPERQDIYLLLAQLALYQNDTKSAIEQLTAGLAKATDVNTIMERLIDLQLQSKNLDAVRALVKQMRDRGTFASEMVRFQDARIKYVENNFQEASREFEAVRPILARFGKAGYAAQVDLMLGRCYEVMNQPDRQLEVYRRVLQASPKQAGARLGEATALQSLGRYEEAAVSIKLLADNVEKLPFLQTTVIYMLINQQLQLPENQRDWTQVDKIADMIFADKSRTELDNALFRSELLMLKGQFDDAQKLLLETQKKFPKESRVWMTLAKLMGRNEKTRGRLPQLLSRIEKEVGDIAALRSERIKLATALEPEKAKAELRQLEQGLDQYSEGEQVSLMLSLGSAYLQVRAFDDAKRCWNFAFSKDPKNAGIRQYLFDLAIDTKDEASVKALLTDLRESPSFGPQSPIYKYCSASEIISKVNRQREGKTGPLSAAEQKSLADARKLVDEGISSRGEWGVLWRLRGEIDQLEGNYSAAIENYQRSLDYSRAGQASTVRRLISLLYATNRIDDANEALKYLGETAPADPLRKIVSDIKEKTGNIDDALEMAKKDVEAQPENPQNHIWYGQFLVRAGRTDDAEVEFRKAVELGPKAEEAWDLLVRHLMASKKKNEAVEAVREAGKQLADNPVTLARLHERVEDNAQAEFYYKTALEADPNNLLAIRRIVEFYLGTNQPSKAVPYLDQMIQKTAKATQKADLDQLAWARRNKAQIVASAGDYEHVMEAIRLIEQNASEDGRLPPDDTLAAFQMLSRRQEPESREKAAKLMTKLQDIRPLLPREQTALAQLYSTSGKWTQARDLLLAAISRRSDDPEILVNLANMLANHEEFDDAERWIERLEDMIKPPATVPDQIKQATRQLRARLLIHKGQKEQAVAALESLVPGPLPQNQLFRLELVAKMMESMGLLEGAERLLNDYMSQEPRGAIAMAAFVGRRGDVDKAFVLLEEARKNQPVTEILPVALEALRLHRDKASKDKFKLLEEWVQAGLQDEANAAHIKMLLAEVYDLQGRYDDVIKTYNDVLASKDLTIYQRAQVQNNLAFTLALLKENAADAVKMTNESMQVLGPISDLLDTRALAYLAIGKTKEAIADLQTAIADTPTGGKYFHLALAEQQAGNLEGARAALAKSEELGANANQLTELEKKSYDKLIAALK
jgi:tetratricopeptide (TPR) repeat protein